MSCGIIAHVYPRPHFTLPGALPLNRRRQTSDRMITQVCVAAIVGKGNKCGSAEWLILSCIAYRF